MIIDRIILLGRWGLDTCAGLGRAGFLLFFSLLKPMPITKLGPLLVRQLYQVGVRSLLIVLVSGLFIGMVLGLQGYIMLVDFGTQDSLGPLVSLSLLRELGPVITALLFAGRAGSALSAEIGLMKTTEQLSSMEMMGVDPMQQVIAPRFWAGIIAMPLLALMFTTIGIFGGYLVGVEWKGIDSGAFWAILQASVEWREDIANCLIKSGAFAFVVTWVALYKGYDATPTADGISRATTETVVHSSLLVLGLDFLLTAIMFGS